MIIKGRIIKGMTKMADIGLLKSGDALGFLTSVYTDWLQIAVILLVISTGILGLVYILGNFLSNDKIKTWARIEVVEVIYSAVLIALTISFLAGANQVAESLVTNPNEPIGKDVLGQAVCNTAFAKADYYDGLPCHIKVGMHFLNSIFNEGNELASEMYREYVITSMLAEVNLNIEITGEKTGVFAYTPIKGFFMQGNIVKSNMFDYTVKLMTITKFQEVLLRFIAMGIFPVMFTIGIILRTFFFTRKLGGLLMAMALSMFFIFPMFYALGGVFYGQMKLKAITVSGDPNALAISSIYVEKDGLPIFGKIMSGGVLGYNEIEAAGKSTYGTDAFSGTGAGSPINKLGGTNLGLDFCGVINDAIVENKTKDMEDEVNIWGKELDQQNWYNPQQMITETLARGGYIDAASRLTFFSLFFSFLGVMASIAAIKSMSAIFGGDLEIAGLTHLI